MYCVALGDVIFFALLICLTRFSSRGSSTEITLPGFQRSCQLLFNTSEGSNRCLDRHCQQTFTLQFHSSLLLVDLNIADPLFVPTCCGGASPGATTAANHHDTSRNLPVTKVAEQSGEDEFFFFFIPVASHACLSRKASRGVPLPRGKRPNLPSKRAHASFWCAASFRHLRSMAEKDVKATCEPVFCPLHYLGNPHKICGKLRPTDRKAFLIRNWSGNLNSSQEPRQKGKAWRHAGKGPPVDFFGTERKKPTRAVVYQWLWQEVIPPARRCFGTGYICIRQPRLVSVCGSDFDMNTWRLPSRTLGPTLPQTGARGNKKGVTGSGIYSLTGGGAAQHVSCHLTPSDLVTTEAWWAGADQSWQIWGSKASVRTSGGEAEEKRAAIWTTVFAPEEFSVGLTPATC